MYFFRLYNMYKCRVNKRLYYILNKLPFQKYNLLKAMKYSMFSGGKRLRPCLVYGIGRMFTVNLITLDVISSAIECIHIYSLIHDDLPCMDNDSLRRGKNSCHIEYNEYISLLAGDAFQSLSFNILSNSIMPGVSNYKRLNMISELSNSIGSSGMCIGQMLDLEKKTITDHNLESINLYKTALLIRSSVRLAYFASRNRSKSILQILDSFAICIGLAFQIKDDIIDFKNDSCSVIKNIKHAEHKIKDLYEKAFLALKSLKKKDFNIKFLENLTKFIILGNQ
ncbi:geranyl transferase [Buchnera aphidicola (Diuraphis noxia)]|uniref:Geranyl transferase n=1 Tax=Buchnera aphidicola subsp. Diuraphis noxia TaxID=118101 RepID=A0A1B2H8V9_BUCDN|nr:polyprenyl synthetase family protein [Buchnera aphidicola]ANZ22654.1 geranyl transferase [Buchnera aphidicola (Diuraphis noxia)]